MADSGRVSVHLHLTTDLYRRVSEQAKRERRTVSQQILRAIEKDLERCERQYGTGADIQGK